MQPVEIALTIFAEICTLLISS